MLLNEKNSCFFIRETTFTHPHLKVIWSFYISPNLQETGAFTRNPHRLWEEKHANSTKKRLLKEAPKSDWLSKPHFHKKRQTSPDCQAGWLHTDRLSLSALQDVTSIVCSTFCSLHEHVQNRRRMFLVQRE